ncbi:MAG: hypothetical protein ACJ79U_02280 [Myxococcales bacterium]
MEPLRVPKRRAEIDVTFADGSARKVAVFLSEQASRHGGEERVRDLLESPAGFLPGIDREGDKVALVAKDSIAVVRTDEPPWDRDEVNLPVEHEVEVWLRGGGRLRGLLSYVLPPQASRPIDYLNGSSRFFTLIEDGRVALVHKTHVLEVVLL